jgi:hypothetical protein
MSYFQPTAIVAGFVLTGIGTVVGKRLDTWSGPKTAVRIVGIVCFSMISYIYVAGQTSTAVSFATGIVISVVVMILIGYLEISRKSKN